ncbi:MAG: hypothetical protein Q9204_004607 [Flavoplaca sp. TL-2023a]
MPKAIYFMSDEEAENSIIALKVGEDGMLSKGSCTLTGGKGASGIDGNNSIPAGPEALFSKSAVSVQGNWMVAVNAGSNTMTLFSIDIKDPTKITMIGQPIDIMGEVPATAAISHKNKIACVGNSGARAVLHLFPFITAIPGRNNMGFLSMLPAQESGITSQDTHSSLMATQTLFASTTIPSTSKIFAPDATFGAATISTQTKPHPQKLHRKAFRNVLGGGIPHYENALRDGCSEGHSR